MDRSAYRIIDANFNRAREGLRVIEEYCRFTLNCVNLSSRTKQIRHELASAIDNLGMTKLITARDIEKDIGKNLEVKGRLERTDVYSCCVAACKRLPEALRAIAELTQLINPDIAQKIENIRYKSYKLEKDIVAFSEPAQKFKRVSLYVIITSNLPVETIFLTQKCIAGGADCIQLRAKSINDDKLYALASEFVKICRDNGVLSIINDRIDIAVCAGADGVHLGQNDLSVRQARDLQLEPLIIGRSTHSLKELESACQSLPTYVSLGPIFATPTKSSIEAVGLNYVEQALDKLSNTGISYVAIGGITLKNINQVLALGVKAIAVCSAITTATDSTAACELFKQKIAEYGNSADK